MSAGMGPPWDGAWTVRPPSNLVAEIWAAHAATIAGADPAGVTGDEGSEWEETPVQPYVIATLRAALQRGMR